MKDLLISKDELSYKFHKWTKSNGNNVLFITGLSGSGKSTRALELSKKHHAYIINLDNFEHAADGNCKYSSKFISLNSKYKLFSDRHWVDVDYEIFYDAANEYFEWLVKKLRTRSTMLFIIEGVQLYTCMDTASAKYVKNQPLIVKTTSPEECDKRIDKRGNNIDFGRHDLDQLKQNYVYLQEFIRRMDIDYRLEVSNMKEAINESILDLFKGENRLRYERLQNISDSKLNDIEARIKSLRAKKQVVDPRSGDDLINELHTMYSDLEWYKSNESRIDPKFRPTINIIYNRYYDRVRKLVDLAEPVDPKGTRYLKDGIESDIYESVDHLDKNVILSEFFGSGNKKLKSKIDIEECMEVVRKNRRSIESKYGKFLKRSHHNTNEVTDFLSYFLDEVYENEDAEIFQYNEHPALMIGKDSPYFSSVRYKSLGYENVTFDVICYKKSAREVTLTLVRIGRIDKDDTFKIYDTGNLAFNAEMKIEDGHIEESAILNEGLTAEERKKLPDSAFGLPKQRKFPLTDKQHVSSAINYFRVVKDEEDQKILANNIIRRYKELKMDSKVHKGNPLYYRVPEEMKSEERVKESAIIESAYDSTDFKGYTDETISELKSAINRMVTQQRLNFSIHTGALQEYAEDFIDAIYDLDYVKCASLHLKIRNMLTYDLSPLEYAFADNLIAITAIKQVDRLSLEKLYDQGQINHAMNIEESVKRDDIVPVYIIMTSTNSAMSSAIKAYTKEPYNHVSFSFDPSLKRMYSFGQGDDGSVGFAIESKDNVYLKRFEDVGMEMYVVFMKQWQVDIIETRLEELLMMSKKMGYSLIGLFGFIINTPISRDGKMFCSEFVDSLFKLADMDLTGKPSALVKPYDFAKVNSNNIYKIYTGNMKGFSQGKAQRAVNLALKKYSPIMESVYTTLNISTYLDLLYEHSTDYAMVYSLYDASRGIFNNSDIGFENDRLFKEYTSVYPILEVKEFPVQFDEDGNLFIKKIDKMDFEKEYYNSHKLLLVYHSSNNTEGIKYELAKLYLMNSMLESKIYDKTVKEVDRNNSVKIRAKILNDFNKYLKYVADREKDFNFSEYYESTPFSDATIKIKKSTIDRSVEIFKKLIMPL